MEFGPDFDFKERVRQATDIVDLVGSYMALRRQGAKFKGLCPFHDDTKPSMQVDPVRQTWMCWVCHEGGDIFSFTMKKEGVNFIEALELLADRAGMEMPRFSRSSKPTVAGTEKPTLYKTLTWATKLFKDYLHDAKDAEDSRIYLDERAIAPESIETFQVGYAPNRRDWLIDQAKAANISMESLLACGLVGKSHERNYYYDWFQGRVMFPIFDTENRVVAFGGRVLPEIAKKIEAEQNRTVGKYVNSPETRVFTKSNLLYGLNLIREEVSKDKKLVIVEGYTDVVMAYQFGLRNTVAALGTAINERHIRLMKRFAEEVILVLDGDDAGQRRTNEILELFVAADVNMRVAVLPDGSDPCDFLIENDTPSFNAFLEKASDALEHKFNIETAGIDLISDTHRANEALEKILQTLSHRPAAKVAGSSVLREQQMLARLARKFGLPESEMRLRLQQLRSAAKSRRRPEVAEERAEKIDLHRLDKKEVELIEVLLSDPHVIERAIENIAAEQMIAGPLREIFELICRLHSSQDEVDFNSVLISIDRPSYKTLLVELDSRATDKQAASHLTTEQRLLGLMELFSQQINDQSRRRVISELEQGDISPDDEADALNRLLEQKRTQIE